MEALNFIYEFRRMCKSIDCSECGVYRCCTESNIPACLLAMKAKPEDVVRIVEEWSKANPEQTNNNKFKEVFGIDFRKLMFDTSANRTLWLNKPYELPKADSEKTVKEIKTHSAQTRREKFKEVFGVEPHDCNGMILGTPQEKTYCSQCVYCDYEGICHMDAHAWWDAPYEAPERKLDINEYKF